MTFSLVTFVVNRLSHEMDLALITCMVNFRPS
jgi:hypothetical protein